MSQSIIISIRQAFARQYDGDFSGADILIEEAVNRYASIKDRSERQAMILDRLADWQFG